MSIIDERIEQGLVRFTGWRIAEDHDDGSLTLIDSQEKVTVRVWPANGGSAAQADRIRQLEADVAGLRQIIKDLG